MKKLWVLMAVIGVVVAAAAISQEAKPAAQKPAPKPVYWCEVCRKVAVAPGNCDGTNMIASHVLSIGEGRCKLCSCPADCKCTIGIDNPTRCTCDKEVMTGNLLGLFVCDRDLFVSNKAGKCPACGADLEEVKPKLAAPEPPPKSEKPKKRTGKTHGHT